MSPTLEKTNLGNNILSPIHIGRIVKRGNISGQCQSQCQKLSNVISGVQRHIQCDGVMLGVRPGCQAMRHDWVQIQPPAAPDHRAAPVVVMGDRQLLCGVGWQVGAPIRGSQPPQAAGSANGTSPACPVRLEAAAGSYTEQLLRIDSGLQWPRESILGSRPPSQRRRPRLICRTSRRNKTQPTGGL